MPSYEITWSRTVVADSAVEAAEQALATLLGSPLLEVDGHEFDVDHPPGCTARTFPGSRLDPPEWCDTEITHWDDNGDPWCGKHRSYEDDEADL